MRIARKFISSGLVFLAVVSFGDAAFSTDDIAVVFRKQQIKTIALDKGMILDTGTINYTLTFGSELWRRHGRNRSDAGLADDMESCARLYRSVCITLEVSNPRQATFEEVTAAIERLKKIASQHASPDCKIEIVVFPRASHGDAPAVGSSRVGTANQRH
jgi:hypothetical protein